MAVGIERRDLHGNVQSGEFLGWRSHVAAVGQTSVPVGRTWLLPALGAGCLASVLQSSNKLPRIVRPFSQDFEGFTDMKGARFGSWRDRSKIGKQEMSRQD
jgi:hypothetical protein